MKFRSLVPINYLGGSKTVKRINGFSRWDSPVIRSLWASSYIRTRAFYVIARSMRNPQRVIGDQVKTASMDATISRFS